jgi:hypothetical protein
MIKTDFLIENKTQLLEIYQKERFFNNGGKEGALFINFTDPSKAEVFYCVMDEITENFREKLIEEMKKNVDINNVSYFIAFDAENSNVISFKH